MKIEITKGSSASTGRARTVYSFPGKDLSHQYFVANVFYSGGKKAVFAAFEDSSLEQQTCIYYAVDLETGDATSISEVVRWESGNVFDDGNFYYTHKNKVYVVDLKTNQGRVLCEISPEYTFHGPVTATRDCRHLGTYYGDSADCATMVRIDLQSGNIDREYEIAFDYPFVAANHGMICPTDPRYMFFAHEGPCSYITNRIWLLDLDTGERHNLYHQKMDGNNTNLEYVGHEAWAYDGSGIFYCKYNISPLKPTGVSFVDWNGNSRCINSDYEHWHVCADRQMKHTVSDTGSAGTESDIVLCDIASGRAALLDHVKRWQRHPGHPHPCFSPDGEKVVYSLENADGKLAVAIMDITDIS